MRDGLSGQPVSLERCYTTSVMIGDISNHEVGGVSADTANSLIAKHWSEVCSNIDVGNMIANFEGMEHLYVIGGWLRDLVHNHIWSTELRSKDIDMVFQGGSAPGFLAHCERTEFNGYTFQTGGITWDFWRLEDTWTFIERYFAPSVETLMRSLTFTVDAILFEPRTALLLANEALQDIRARSLRLNCDIYLDRLGSLQAYRAAKVCEKYGYTPTADTKRILRDKLNEDKLRGLLEKEARKANVSPQAFVAQWLTKVLETIP